MGKKLLKHGTTAKLGNQLIKIFREKRKERRGRKRLRLKARKFILSFNNTIYFCPFHPVSKNILFSKGFHQNLFFSLKEKLARDIMYVPVKLEKKY